MNKTIMITFLCLLLALPCFARDYIVEFEDENYREEQKSFSYSPIIYHSIQVRSSAGPKLLVLTGDNYNYRKWLRHYIAQGKAFIAKVPEDQIDQFITASAFDIDVTRLHPFDLEQYKKSEAKSRQIIAPLGAQKADHAGKAVLQKKADLQRTRTNTLDRERRDAKAEDRKKEYEAFFAAMTEQMDRKEKQRKQALEQRWQEFKQRLLQD